MTELTPSQLARLDTVRLAAYRQNLDFYSGTQWPSLSRHRQLTFNYAKVAVDKCTSYLMQGLTFACYPTAPTDDLKATAVATEQLLRDVYEQNNLQQLDWETEIDAAVLGDACYKVTWDSDDKRIRVTAPDVSGIFAWWLGDDLSKVWRVASRYTLTQDEVQMLYGDVTASKAKQSRGIATSPSPPRNDKIRVTEVWTAKTLDLFLDNDPIDSRPNPYGFIPFVIFPEILPGTPSSFGLPR